MIDATKSIRGQRKEIASASTNLTDKAFILALYEGARLLKILLLIDHIEIIMRRMVEPRIGKE